MLELNTLSQNILERSIYVYLNFSVSRVFTFSVRVNYRIVSYRVNPLRSAHSNRLWAQATSLAR